MFLTVGARLIPAAQVALITLLEVVLGPLWVWLAVGERPSTATLSAARSSSRRSSSRRAGSAPPRRREEAAVPVR